MKYTLCVMNLEWMKVILFDLKIKKNFSLIFVFLDAVSCTRNANKNKLTSASTHVNNTQRKQAKSRVQFETVAARPQKHTCQENKLQEKTRHISCISVYRLKTLSFAPVSWPLLKIYQLGGVITL